MYEKTKKIVIILLFLSIIFSILNITSAYAETGCCAHPFFHGLSFPYAGYFCNSETVNKDRSTYPYGCCPADASAPSGFYQTGNANWPSNAADCMANFFKSTCAQLDKCDLGCCCNTVQGTEITARGWCEAGSYIFYEGITNEHECDLKCAGVECTTAADCADKTCQTKSCESNVCVYTTPSGKCSSDADCTPNYCNLNTCTCTSQPPVCNKNTLCEAGETVLNCPEDCCENDCTAKYDNICHLECVGHGYCSNIFSGCDGKQLSTEICVDATSHGQCCTSMIAVCSANEICQNGKCITKPLCNNHIIDSGEDCDFGVSGNPIFGIVDTCKELGFASGTLGCTSNCKFDTTNCVFEPSFETVCNNNQDDDKDNFKDCFDTDCTGKTCSGSTTCNSQNSIDNMCCPPDMHINCGSEGIKCGACDCRKQKTKPIIDSIRHYRGEKKVKINWHLDCNADETSFWRCDGTQTSCKWEDNDYKPISEEDATIAPETDYCYVVSATYGSDIIQSDAKCIRTSDKECLDYKDEFCLNNARYNCEPASSTKDSEDGFKIDPIEACDTGYYCAGPYADGTTQCIYDSDCTKCNALFGLFGAGGTTDYEGDDSYQCDQIENCYYDYTTTTVDKYYDCDAEANDQIQHSCYAYRSKSACEENKCFPERDCEWAPVKDVTTDEAPFYIKILEALFPQYFEFGSGVCRDANAENQQCGLCSSPSNTVFGKCTKETCSMYGLCYFNGASCLSAGEMNCEKYTTNENDCINGQNVDVDVIWQNNKKVSGTNAILKPSNDYLALGLCRWTGNKCVKDADESTTRDLYPIDMTPPVTELEPVVKIGKKKLTEEGIGYTVEESSSDVYKTYFSIIPEGEDCTVEDNYPQDESSCSGNYYCPTPIQMPTESGNYKICYFSEDKSNNLEVVKSKTIEYDNKGPVIEHGYIIENRQQTTADLIIQFKVTNENADYCTIDLEDYMGSPETQRTEDNVLKGALVEENGYVINPTHIYGYKIKCYDNVGDEGTAFNTIFFDQLEGLYPFGTIKEQYPNIVFKSKSEWDCRWGLDEEGTSGDMTVTGPVGDYTYKSDKSITSTPEDKTYTYYIECDFSNTNQYSKIPLMFTIDTTPPVTTLWDAVIENKPFDLDKWHTATRAKLKCNDPEIWPTNDPKFGEFGCKDMFYCVEPGYCNPTTAGKRNANDESEITTDTINQMSYLCYYSTDAGGNAENPPKCNQIKIDSTDPVVVVTEYQPTISASMADIKGHIENYAYYGDYDGLADYSFGNFEFYATLNIPAKVSWKIYFRKSIQGTYSLYYDGTELHFLKNGLDFGHTPKNLGVGQYKIKLTAIGNVFKFDIGENEILTAEDGSSPYSTGLIELDGTGVTLTAIKVKEDALASPIEIVYAGDENNLFSYNSDTNTFEGAVYGLQEGINTVEIFAKDESGNIGSATIIITVIRTGPSPPEFIPSFTPYLSYYSIYPSHLQYHSGDVFYTNQNKLFITGQATASSTKITLYTNDDAPQDFGLWETEEETETYTALQAASAGTDKITLAEIPPADIINYFVKFGHDLTDYGYYGFYYDVSGVDVGTKTITISPKLQEDVTAGETITVYDNAAPSQWFGLYTKEFKEGYNQISADATDSSGNKGERTDKYVIFYDKRKPEIDYTYPGENWVINHLDALKITITDSAQSSKLYRLKIKINGNDMPVSIPEFTDYIGFIQYNMTIAGTFDDGTYIVEVEAMDKAGNKAEKIWQFTINSSVPDGPQLVFTDAAHTQIWLNDYDLPDSTYFINTEDTHFDLIFDEDVYLDSIKLVKDTTVKIPGCTKSGSVFRCDADLSPKPLGQGNYILQITSRKAGETTTQGYVEYGFVVDTSKPAVSMETPKYIGSSNPFWVYLNVAGESHILHYLLSIDQSSTSGLMYLFKINLTGLELTAEEGTKTITATITDQASNSETKSNDVTVDNTPPDRINIDYITPVDAGAKAYNFVTNDRNIYVHGTVYDNTGGSEIDYICYVPDKDDTVSCDDTKQTTSDGAFIIQAKLISEGDVTENNITIIAVDKAGNKANSSQNITLDLTGDIIPLLEIKIIEPRHGVSAVKPFDAIFETSRDVDECRYRDQNAPFDYMEALERIDGSHYKLKDVLEGLAENELTVYLRCYEHIDQQSVIYVYKFKLVFDETPPTIEKAYAYPNPVSEIIDNTMQTTLTVETNENTICRYDADESDYTKMSGLFDGYDANNKTAYKTKNTKLLTGLVDKETYFYYVACEDYAGLITEPPGKITFTTNLDEKLHVTITNPADGSFTNETTIKLEAETNQKADCDFSSNPDNIDRSMASTDYYKHWTTLGLPNQEKTYTYWVKCCQKTNPSNCDTKSTTFGVDKSPPSKPDIDDGNKTGYTDRLTASWIAYDNISQISEYKYAIGSTKGSNNIHNWTTTGEAIETVSGLNLTDKQTYYWAVRAKNGVGLWGEINYSDGVTIDVTIIAQPNCTDKIKNGNETDVDCGGNKCPKCENNESCKNNSDCDSGLCSNITDKCISPLCTNLVKDAGETDIDCGGDCDVCNNGKGCEANSDCVSYYCKSNVCTEPKCDDNIKNGQETDTDCGGAVCEPCGTGDDCEHDSDCESKNCVNDKCAAPTCTDKIWNGNETDVDCGGNKCNPCDNGKKCETDNDCNSTYCAGKRCADTCSKDSDGDGMTDCWETQHGLNPNDPDDAQEDPDSDELTNLEEYQHNTDPKKKDTDGDGFSDAVELAEGYDPLDPTSHPSSHIWTIILLIVAILVLLGGGGYFIYNELKKQKQAKTMPRMQQQPMRPMQMQPQMPAMGREEIRRKEEIGHKILVGREKEREKKRGALFKGFEEKKPGEQQEEAVAGAGKGGEVKPAEETEGKEAGEWVMLGTEEKKAPEDTLKEIVGAKKSKDIVAELKKIAKQKKPQKKTAMPAKAKVPAKKKTPEKKKTAKKAKDDVFKKLESEIKGAKQKKPKATTKTAAKKPKK